MTHYLSLIIHSLSRLYAHHLRLVRIDKHVKTTAQDMNVVSGMRILATLRISLNAMSTTFVKSFIQGQMI